MTIEADAGRRPLSRETLGLLLGALGVLVFGGSFPFTRLAVAALDPWFVTAGRPAVAGLLAAGTLLAMRRPLPTRSDWPKLAFVALALVLGFPGLSNFAMRLAPASHAGVVTGVLPLVTAACGALWLGERPSRAFWASAAAGCLLVLAFTLRDGGGGLDAADGLLGAAILICAMGYVASADVARRMAGWEVIAWALVISLPVSLPAALALWPSNPAAVPAASWLGFAYVCVMSQFLGFFAWNAGLALGGVARVSQVQLGQTFVTLAIAALVLGERVDPVTWAFAAGVVAVVLMGRRAGIRRAAPAPDATA